MKRLDLRKTKKITTTTVIIIIAIKSTAEHSLDKSQEKNNHLIYMDNIKLFAKNKKELKTLKHAVRIYNNV